MGFIFQFYNLIQNLTAKENVELAKKLDDARKAGAEKVLKKNADIAATYNQ